MWRKLFIDHPATVDETYGQHFGQALRFSLKLIGAGLACLIHALVPGLFKTTARSTVIELNETLVTHRRQADRPEKNNARLARGA